MNIDKNIISTKLTQALAFCQKHALILGIGAFGILYSYIIIQVTTIANKTPDETQVTQKIQAVPHPKINKETAQKIEGLEDQNVNVQAIFNEARDNPFSE